MMMLVLLQSQFPYAANIVYFHIVVDFDAVSAAQGAAQTTGAFASAVVAALSCRCSVSFRQGAWFANATKALTPSFGRMDSVALF